MERQWRAWCSVYASFSTDASSSVASVSSTPSPVFLSIFSLTILHSSTPAYMLHSIHRPHMHRITTLAVHIARAGMTRISHTRLSSSLTHCYLLSFFLHSAMMLLYRRIPWLVQAPVIIVMLIYREVRITIFPIRESFHMNLTPILYCTWLWENSRNRLFSL